MLKLGSITDAPSAVVAIKNPVTGERLATITVAGPEHPKRRAIELSKQRRMLSALARTGKIDVGDPVDLEQERLDLLVACTLAWEDVCDEDGKPIPCTADNVRKVYTAEGNGWLRKQVADALEQHERFVMTSAAG